MTTLPHTLGSETSRAAAESMEKIAPTIRRRVYNYIAAQGALGATDSQIEIALSLRHQTGSARRRELELMGAIKRSGECRPTASGRSAGVYVVVPGVSPDIPIGRPRKAAAEARARRVSLHLTRGEYAALCELATDRDLEAGAMARLLMAVGYRATVGEVMA